MRERALPDVDRSILRFEWTRPRFDRGLLREAVRGATLLLGVMALAILASALNALLRDHELSRRAALLAPWPTEAEYFADLVQIGRETGRPSSHEFWFRAASIAGASPEIDYDAWDRYLDAPWDEEAQGAVEGDPAMTGDGQIAELFATGIEANNPALPPYAGPATPIHNFPTLAGAFFRSTREALGRDGPNPKAIALCVERAARFRVAIAARPSPLIHGLLGQSVERRAMRLLRGAISRGEFDPATAAALARSLVAARQHGRSLFWSSVDEWRSIESMFLPIFQAAELDYDTPAKRRSALSQAKGYKASMTDREVAANFSSERLRQQYQQSIRLVAAIGRMSPAKRSEREADINNIDDFLAPWGFIMLDGFGTPNLVEVGRRQDIHELSVRLAMTALALQSTTIHGDAPPPSPEEAIAALELDARWALDPFTETPFLLEAAGAPGLPRNPLLRWRLRAPSAEILTERLAKSGSTPDGYGWLELEFPLGERAASDSNPVGEPTGEDFTAGEKDLEDQTP